MNFPISELTKKSLVTYNCVIMAVKITINNKSFSERIQLDFF